MESARDLRLFLHVCETLNFGRSSVECHVSAATLTRAIQRLEQQSGHRLLDRGPRGVSLTVEGLRFREYAQSALDLWQQYLATDPAPDGLSGQLSIFATVTACQVIVPDLLGPFRSSHPLVRIELQTGDASVALARVDEGAVDFAVAALPERLPEALVSRPLLTSPLIFIRSSTATAPVDWKHGPYVLPRTGLVRNAAHGWFHDRRIRPEIAAEPDGHEALLALVALGYGVGIVPRLVLDSNPLSERIVEVPAEPPLTTSTIGLCVRRIDLRRPLVSALWSMATADGT